jgi:hypothetical protein
LQTENELRQRRVIPHECAPGQRGVRGFDPNPHERGLRVSAFHPEGVLLEDGRAQPQRPQQHPEDETSRAGRWGVDEFGSCSEINCSEGFDLCGRRFAQSISQASTSKYLICCCARPFLL